MKPIREVQGSLKDDLRDLLHNRPWWILLGAGVAALVFNSIRDGATVYYFKYFVVEEDYSTVSLFGVSFVLSGLYLAVGQAANIVGVILAAPVSNRIGKKNTYMGAMSLATIPFRHFLLVRKRRYCSDLCLPGTHQHLCRKYLPFALVDVRRLCRLFRTEDRQPGYGADLFLFVHEPEVRMGYRKCIDRLATGLLRISCQRGAECRSHSRN